MTDGWSETVFRNIEVFKRAPNEDAGRVDGVMESAEESEMLVPYEQCVAFHIAEYNRAEKNPSIQTSMTNLSQHRSEP